MENTWNRLLAIGSNLSSRLLFAFSLAPVASCFFFDCSAACNLIATSRTPCSDVFVCGGSLKTICTDGMAKPILSRTLHMQGEERRLES